MLGIVGPAIFGVVVMLVVMLSVLGDLAGSVGDLGRTIAAISGKAAHSSVSHSAGSMSANSMIGASGITMRDFLTVRTGMSLGEVTGIIGSGDEISRSEHRRLQHRHVQLEKPQRLEHERNVPEWKRREQGAIWSSLGNPKCVEPSCLF